MGFDSLHIGATGLSVAQRALDVASQNIANANTPGYTRQRAEIVNAMPTPGVPGLRGDGMRGNGVTVDAITRMRDLLADLAYRAQSATAGQASAKQTVLGQAEQVLGSIGDGVASSLDSFWSSWNQLSINPTDPAARSGVMTAGSNLATEFNNIAQAFSNITPDVRTQIANQTDRVNSLLQHVAELNKSIADAVSTAQTPSDLMDERDRSLDELANLTGATARQADGGRVDVYFGSEAVVRGETYQKVSATIAPDAPDVQLPNGTTATLGGQLRGYIDAVTVDLPAFQTQLDQIANTLRDTINAVQNAGYDISNGPTATGNPGIDFFAGSGAAGLKVNPALTGNQIAASKSGSPNDGSNALAISQLRTAPVISSVSIGDAVHGFLGLVGQAAQTANDQSSAADTVLAGTDRTRASLDSVNSDDEMVDMLKYQRAYQAAARVITISDGLMDTLIHMGA